MKSLQRTMDFLKTGAIEHLNQAQSKHWQMHQYTRCMPSLSWLNSDDWNKMEGIVNPGALTSGLLLPSDTCVAGQHGQSCSSGDP